ncbi:hypothetical protein AVEN_230167-1 [Araneus ventricosus]|uniref:Uncharacterized protein n=1 Tax=Araneus ventricosus TaxID=182803 RepID=A0A4Y2R9J8_ARAVE|nr:hypothetical protein AVEN_230167-1 [Araneus ventricosus]
MTDKEIIAKINAEIFDEELDQQEHKKVTVKEAEKTVELLRYFLESIENIGSESFGVIATLEKTVQLQKDSTGPQYALADIEELLKSYNLSLQKLHLPTVDLPASVSKKANFDVVDEQTEANSYAKQLNSDQRNVVEILLSAVYTTLQIHPSVIV